MDKDLPENLPRILPRILIDARMVREVPHGFARYITALATGLEQLQRSGPLPYEPIFLMSPEYLKQTNAPAVFKNFPIVTSISHAHSLVELWILPREIKGAKADLFHSPSYVSLLRCPCPHVSTVHDLNHLHFGSRKQKLYYRRILKPFLKRARKVITVSEFSRGELVHWLGRPPASIAIAANAVERVVHFGNFDSTIEKVLTKYSLQSGKYFLVFSNAKDHKNLAMLVRAHRLAREKFPDIWPLVLSVAPGEIPETLADIGIRCLGTIGDDEGKVLLHACGAVPFPSLYEGFGLPPLEAAIAGKKILVSSIPPHREALQDFGADEVLWLDPKNETAWSEAFASVAAGDARLRDPQAASIQKACDRFSPIRLAREMDRIYRDVLAIKS